MKKKLMIILLTGVILAAGAFTAVYFSSPKKTETATTGSSDLLVSITDQKLMTAYYENQKKLYQEKMTDYPAMALDRKNQFLYYTNTDSGNQKHLIRLNLKSGEKTTLYSGDEYIDGLSLSNDGSKLYMRYNLSSERNFHLASFDLRKSEFTILFPTPNNKDESVSYYLYNQNNGRFVLLHYSVEEDYQKTDEANNKGIPPEPTNMRISLADEKGVQNIKTIAKFINDVGLSPDGGTILFTESDDDREKTSIYAMDTATKKYKTIISDQQAFKLIDSAQPQFSKDGKKIFFLAEGKDAKLLEDETGSEAKVRTIYSYDMKTKKVTKEWEKPNGIINGFTVLD
ncbi:hypothetical protein P9D34_05160 [Bacillus swezeyi]|uniref:Protein TolB n=1 Tax=Bacillus swezeyi TaxID=1925020 RepID=A0A1R1QZP2_9BACI|nr:hypothetical protein [Bacillus swezeyi]MEC1259845.1 hypothetical protein [Bacillus swezeyi]MED2930041.1 hypothetical protein [Bacillus swezeyi]MED2963068.1 hypothetical protein [Bacillus swezeyi]MED3074276.1 hypothetical protein [Bacillus swezeyi]MED3083526.1 hypothetical protein [Bacillus swezeyi]